MHVVALNAVVEQSERSVRACREGGSDPNE
jgi:hypothetical protein